jgi:hypothetical protein
MLSSPPSRAAHSSDDAPVYPIQQSEMSAGRLPSSSFSAGRPSGPHMSQVPQVADPARARTHYSWPPPSTSGDPRTPTHGARPSVTWSPTGTNFADTNPATQHSPYYSQPQAHQPPTTSPNVNPRELYLSHQYARAGTSGWTPRTPTSPDITDRRISTSHSLGSMTSNQPPYTSPYIDEHRRDGYDGATQRGA